MNVAAVSSTRIPAGLEQVPLTRGTRTDQQPIIDRIIAINEAQSRKFVAARAARYRYWSKHPTFFAITRCMDGRHDISDATETALGLVKQFCAIGGRFEIWWPSFAKRLWNWARIANGKGLRCCVLASYHYSTSEGDLGCAGWRMDTKAARGHAERLAREITEDFTDQIYAIAVGFDTDCDALTLHGTQDVSGEQCIGLTHNAIRSLITNAFPTLPDDIIRDIVPLLEDNAKHIARLRAAPRAHEALRHQERVIAIGHGFEYWITERNLAAVVNDVDPNLDVPIATAAQIVWANLTSAPAGDDALLLACVPYDRYGIERNIAVRRARGLHRFAEQSIRERHPSLIESGRLRTLIGVTNEETKLIEIVESA